MTLPILKTNAYAEIYASILDGRLTPGSVIEENDLATHCNVTRARIREALRKLADEGMVAFEPKKGIRLLRPTPEMAREVFQIREVLEGVAAREAAKRMEDATRQNLHTYLNALRPRIRAGDVSDVGDPIHEAILAACGNKRLVHMLAVLRRQVRWLQTVAKPEPARTAKEFKEHMAILAALEARDPQAAEEAGRAHIRGALADILKAFKASAPQEG